MKTYLRVPFAEKDEAKRLGARWDPAKKLWYVQSVPNLAAFERWLPAQGDLMEAAAKPAAAVRTKAAPAQAGAHYFELPCDCLPWVGCEKCEAVVDARGWLA
ncbi:DUF5710 domain-containing protein [uncultured Zoogloea sp.]|uniref:DUF5710 domain-containing protein n=1 Tax=uncultured Zoogloea sp. TaxID=160237 RepID=UPI002603C482|nr:DUF5710 domain-containing protein [uncultured Zoogloea sp.]